MEKEFVSYDRALRLKALGFNETCISFYSKGGKHNYDVQSPCTNIGSWNDQEYYCSAPTFSQAFRWFRENCGLSTYITLKMNYGKRVSFYVINELDNILVKNMFFKSKISIYYNSYEEAELACLDKLIEIVESKQKEDE